MNKLNKKEVEVLKMLEKEIKRVVPIYSKKFKFNFQENIKYFMGNESLTDISKKDKGLEHLATKVVMKYNATAFQQKDIKII